MWVDILLWRFTAAFKKSIKHLVKFNGLLKCDNETRIKQNENSGLDKSEKTKSSFFIIPNLITIGKYLRGRYIGITVTNAPVHFQ